MSGFFKSGNGEKGMGNQTLSRGLMFQVARTLQFPIPDSPFPLHGPAA